MDSINFIKRFINLERSRESGRGFEFQLGRGAKAEVEDKYLDRRLFEIATSLAKKE